MADYRIITDATIDLTAAIVEEIGVSVIPMRLMLDGCEYTHYPDERELSLKSFYEKLKEGAKVSTSQIAPTVYEEYFENELREGRDVIYICLSSGLSGTYNTSCMIASELREKYPERRIECVDSLCASVGEGLLVRLAAQKKAEGADFDSLLKFVLETRGKICHWFMVEDMEQLKRGGRINAVEAVLGGALHIIPILSLDAEGRLYVVTKTRGVRKALAYIKARLAVDAYEPNSQRVIVAHGNCPERAEELMNDIMSENMALDVAVCGIGPVIGSHTGTGMCALTFVGDTHSGNARAN